MMNKKITSDQDYKITLKTDHLLVNLQVLIPCWSISEKRVNFLNQNQTGTNNPQSYNNKKNKKNT